MFEDSAETSRFSSFRGNFKGRKNEQNICCFVVFNCGRDFSDAGFVIYGLRAQNDCFVFTSSFTVSLLDGYYLFFLGPTHQ